MGASGKEWEEQEVGMDLVEEQVEEGEALGLVKPNETWVPLGWTVSFQGVGLV